MTQLWIVGQVIAPGETGPVWEFQGVFESEVLALAACVGPKFFLGPAQLNERIASETQPWVGCYFPRR